MQTTENKLKTAMKAGKVQRGIWLNTGSAFVAELAGNAGFDWCLLDAEHGANSIDTLQTQLQVLAATPTQAVIRVTAAEPWMIKQVLDIGAQTVLVPMVDDANTAALMGQAMRYPPEGIRGMGAALARASSFGAMTNYVHEANAQICLIVQAESRAALKNIDAIAAAQGVDGVFIGPADLSADMGYPGNPKHPEVSKAMDHMIDRIKAAGKIAGILMFDEADAAHYAGKGVEFLGVGSDVAVLARGLRALATKTKF